MALGLALAVLLLSASWSLSQYADAQTKYLLYENKQYGFSIKYPSTWTKTEILKKDDTYSNMIQLVGFQNPAKDSNFMLGLVQGDGGTTQKIIDESKNQVSAEFKPAFCAQAPAGVSCSVDLFEEDFTTKNGYDGHALGVVAQMSSTQTNMQIVPIGLGTIPDGTNTWIMVFANLAIDDNAQNVSIFSEMSDSFLIFNYKGVQKAQSTPTLVRSAAGELQLNSNSFFVTKYSPAELIISGKVANPLQGVTLDIVITKSGGGSEQQTVTVTRDGSFKFPIKLDGNWQPGTYSVSAKYGGTDIGTLSFQISATQKPADIKTTQIIQKQFQLSAKADQKDDTVFIVIKNPKGSASVYGIKITTSSNLSNYAKVKDWTPTRAGSDSVIYQTTSSPLKSSDVIKIKLKVEGKNTEIKWEAFAKNQKSLGTGVVKN